MKNRRLLILGGLVGLCILGIAAAVTNRTPLLRAFLQSNLDGNGYAVTNADSFTATGTPGFIGDGSGLTGLAGGGDVTTAQLQSATNPTTLAANGMATKTYADTSSQNATNTARLAINLASSFDASGSAATAAQNATNTARLAINLAGSFDALGAAQTATNQLAIANTNQWDPINSALNATNTTRLAVNLAATFDALNAAQNSTNTARLAINLAGSFDALNAAQVATNQLAIANTNQWDPINSALNATNTTRLAANLAGSFDALNAAQNATNTTRLAANLAASFDALNAAQTATNQLAIANTNQWDPINSALNATNTTRLAANLAGSFDAINAAQNATNTTRLAANLAGSFDALNAAQNATNTTRLAANLAASFDAANTALNATNGIVYAAGLVKSGATTTNANTAYTTNALTTVGNGTATMDMLNTYALFITNANFTLSLANVPVTMDRPSVLIISNSLASGSTIILTASGFSFLTNGVPTQTAYLTNLTAKSQVAYLSVNCYGPALTNAVLTHFYNP